MQFPLNMRRNDERNINRTFDFFLKFSYNAFLVDEVSMKTSNFMFILFISVIVGFSVTRYILKQGQIESQSQTMVELEQKNQKQVREILDTLNRIQNILNEIEKK